MKHRKGSLKIGKMGQILLGALYSLTVIIALAALISALLLMSENPLSLTGAASIAVVVIGGVITGITLTRVLGSYGVWLSLFSSLLLSACTMIAVLISDGGELNLKLPLNAIIYVSSSVLSAYLARPRAKRRRF